MAIHHCRKTTIGRMSSEGNQGDIRKKQIGFMLKTQNFL